MADTTNTTAVKLTNITAEDLEVPALGGTFGAASGRLIKAGETVEVAKEDLANHIWPAETWKVDGTRVQQHLKVPDPEPLNPEIGAATDEPKSGTKKSTTKGGE